MHIYVAYLGGFGFIKCLMYKNGRFSFPPNLDGFSFFPSVYWNKVIEQLVKENNLLRIKKAEVKLFVFQKEKVINCLKHQIYY